VSLCAFFSTRGVAVQVAFESKLILKTVFHFIAAHSRKGWETRRFRAMGKLNSFCTAPPRRQLGLVLLLGEVVLHLPQRPLDVAAQDVEFENPIFGNRVVFIS
jgi:hypothetical protein